MSGQALVAIPDHLNTDYYLLAAFFKNLKDFMVVIVPVFTSSHSEQSS